MEIKVYLSKHSLAKPFRDGGVISLGGQEGRGDLLPASRTRIKFVRPVTMENDGHEEEQIYRRKDHWVLAASQRLDAAGKAKLQAH